MLIISADTSGKNGSIALARGGPDGSCVTLAVVPLAGGTFSAQLVPQIAGLLAKHGFDKKDIGALTIASGPGSFTGLRVGLAAMKGLAEALHVPIAAVSLLEVVVSAGQSKGRVLAALDAGRNEVYAGEYQTGSPLKMLSERLLTRAEFLAAAAGLAVITPDSSIAEAACNHGLEVEEIARPQSDAIASAGLSKIRAGETVSTDNLEANYIRRSDAEIFFKAEP